tara:strand:- start:82855 stop:83928 length:1074 start_codon:yes stop_codon:yes gene_type:complete
MTVRVYGEAFFALASAKKKDPTKYAWYQITRGKVKLDNHHKTFEVELSKGEKFGLKRYRNDFFLIDEDDLTIQFKLSAEEAKEVVRRSKGFSGKIDGKDVNPGVFEFDGQPPKGHKKPGPKPKTKTPAAKTRGKSQAAKARTQATKVNKLLRQFSGEDKEVVRSVVESLRDNDLESAGHTLKTADTAVREPVLDVIDREYWPALGFKAPVSKPSSSRRKKAARKPQTKASKHPGLEIPQGQTAKQDKQGENLKRIAEKDITPTLKKFGLKLERVAGSPSDWVATTAVDAKTIRTIKDTFQNAGWKIDYRKGGSKTRRRGVGGSFTYMNIALTGANRHITIQTTGKSKGRLVIRSGKS